jgi:DNA polymerase III alpha subunit
VYDVEMGAPSHTIIAESGLVVSNSHSYSVAGDSMYGAYLKSHYPLEFYEVLLNLCEEDGDKERLAMTKDEAKKAYKIKFPPFRFGQDNRAIVSNKEKWEITSSLQSIKGFGKKVGEDMFALANNKFNNFLDLLIFAEDKGMLYSYFEKLIQIQYFDEFGGNLKLHKLYKEFIEGKNRYVKTHTEKTKAKRIQELRTYWKTLPDESYNLVSQIEMELSILGSIHAQYNIPREYLYVMSVDTQYAPRIETYCLATGTVNSLKIRKKIYENNIFYGGDIIKLDMASRSDGSLMFFTKEPRRKFENGIFVDSDDEFDWWSARYEVVQVDSFTKIVENSY